MSSGMMDDRTAARLLGGSVVNGAISCPGPGHGPRNRNLRVWLHSTAAGGIDFTVYSFAGHPWQVCKDYVAQRLGLASDYWKQEPPVDPAEEARRAKARQQAEARERADITRRQRAAARICQEGRDPRETVVQDHLARRRLELPAEIAGSALFHHPRCPGWDGRVQAMIAPLRCVRTGKIIGVHRTALTDTGEKIGRKMLGTAAEAAVMLDPLCAVTDTLVVAEGIETALAGRQYFDLAPIWALGSSGSIANLPVLAAVKTLVVVAENDAGASAAAIKAAGTRWQAAGRQVEIVTPPPGAKDLNDAVMGGV